MQEINFHNCDPKMLVGLLRLGYFLDSSLVGQLSLTGGDMGGLFGGSYCSNGTTLINNKQENELCRNVIVSTNSPCSRALCWVAVGRGDVAGLLEAMKANRLNRDHDVNIEHVGDVSVGILCDILEAIETEAGQFDESSYDFPVSRWPAFAGAGLIPVMSLAATGIGVAMLAGVIAGAPVVVAGSMILAGVAMFVLGMDVLRDLCNERPVFMGAEFDPESNPESDPMVWQGRACI